MLVPIIVSVLLATTVIYVVIANKKGKTPQKSNDKVAPSIPSIPSMPNNYITPKDFSVGPVKGDPPSSNLCDHNVLYPINGLKPDYDWGPLPENCACTEFLQSP